jgi:anhydro-N-acetylmuramic acid kinase
MPLRVAATGAHRPDMTHQPESTRIWTAVGVISGTSMDGIDVAAIETDGGAFVRPLAGRIVSYPSSLKAELDSFLEEPERALADPLSDLERQVTEAHAAAVDTFLAGAGLDRAQVDVIGLHGQTVYHRPADRFTRQLMDGPLAASLLKRDVVYRFRHADVAAGGQGAPLVPLYHRAMTASLPQPVMVLNLGGVANVTYIDGDTVLAFDTGPASALLDDFVKRRRGWAFDHDGALAASGRADHGILAHMLASPFFGAPPPKSLDRNEFHESARLVEALSDADGAATLAAFTVEATAAALRHLPRAPRRWLVAGGGRLNRHLMAGFRQRLGVPVDPVEAEGWNGDLTEAECFAYLAVRSRLGLPLSLPTTTGAPRPMPGGDFAPH